MRHIIRAALAAAALIASGSSIAQLAARDINLDGVTDAYYDSAQDITWLADANLAASQGIESQYGAGYMSWQQAQQWVTSLDVYSVSGWRLPTSYVPNLNALCNGGLGDFGACLGMVRFETEGTRMTSDMSGATFANASGAFWTGNLYSGPLGGNDLVQVWSPGAAVGGYTDELSTPFGRAWAVHDGDVAPVPEPSTYALMLLGLAIVGIARRVASRRG